MTYHHTDGGRAAAGYKGLAEDCACRALAIAAEIQYRTAYDLINAFCADVKGRKKRWGKSSARTGVHHLIYHRVLAHLGWKWTPTKKIGSSARVRVRSDELPKGRLILSLSRHYAAFIDGELLDNHDSSRDGTRLVYGYWIKEGDDS
jgi:hypothetical protein